jgi:hypothetical protein
MSQSRFCLGMILAAALAAAIVSAPAQSLFSQGGGPKPVTVSHVKPVSATPGGKLEVPLLLEIPPELHINADKPTFDYLIPTRLEWTSKDFKLVGIEYPKSKQFAFSFAPGSKLDVYEGSITVVSRFEVPRSAKPGKVTLEGKLRYQACDDRACYPPRTIPVEVPVEIKAK